MNIAFIPARAGSKSIKNKNFKILAGKPLICWAIEASLNSKNIDSIVIATNDSNITQIARNYSSPKIEIYERSEENAQDTSSTESVILEYIKQRKLSPHDVFILIQATNPFIRSHHLKEALDMYKNNDYKSILSAAISKRFFWGKDHKPINYDPQNRPRRQDFDGVYIENGAFYINTVSNILKSKNRITSPTGIYEMEEKTQYEIDEPEDFIIIEHLMQSQFKNINKIKLVLTDVDGVLTDAGMYYDNQGNELKKFNTLDGMGFQLLRERNIKTGIITSEDTEIVAQRAKKLKVDFLFQGAKNKKSIIENLCEKHDFKPSEIAYIGDDINCKSLLEFVGIKACPNNATHSIKQIIDIIHLEKSGGEGAFRQFAEFLIKNKCLIES